MKSSSAGPLAGVHLFEAVNQRAQMKPVKASAFLELSLVSDTYEVHLPSLLHAS